MNFAHPSHCLLINGEQKHFRYPQNYQHEKDKKNFEYKPFVSFSTCALNKQM